MGPNQNHKNLHNKGNHKQNGKTSYSWEKISWNDTTNKGLIFKTYKQLIWLRIKKKQPNQKMSRGPKWTFLQRRHTDDQQTHENMLNIANCSVQFSSVAQSCLTLCDPMNCSTPGLPVHHQLPEFTQTHVHRVGDAIQPSPPRSSPSPPAPNPSQHQSLFQ